MGRCWELYAEAARSLVSNGVLDSGVRPADLICGMPPMYQVWRNTAHASIVRSLGTDYRLGIYRFHQQLGSNPDPPDLEFLEFTDPQNPKPVQWIYDASQHDAAQFNIQEEMWASSKSPSFGRHLHLEMQNTPIHRFLTDGRRRILHIGHASGAGETIFQSFTGPARSFHVVRSSHSFILEIDAKPLRFATV